MNHIGKTVARFLPLLLGFTVLSYLLAVRLNWITGELSSAPENNEVVSSPVNCVISLSLSPRGKETRRNFTWGEKIYARARLQGVSSGLHEISFYWTNPRGRLQESYKKTFSPRGGRYNCWSWLNLKGGDWFPVSVGSFGPAKFRGRWRVRVDLDGKLLTVSEFEVE